MTIRNQPQKAYAPPGGYDYRAKSHKRKTIPGIIKSGQHLVVAPVEMLAAGQVATSTRMHCLDGAKLKSICRTVQVLPECLRLRKVPAVHCNIAKTKDQPEIQNTDHSPDEWAS